MFTSLRRRASWFFLSTVSNLGPKYKKVATLDEAVAALSEASQEPKADTDKVDDMDETIDVMEQDADQKDDPVDTQVDTQQSTAQPSLVRWMVPMMRPQ